MGVFMQLVLAWIGSVLVKAITNILVYSPAILVALLLHDILQNKRR